MTPLGLALDRSLDTQKDCTTFLHTLLFSVLQGRLFVRLLG
jgi:hypothetical protein